VAGGWKKLKNEERHNLYASPHIIRVIESKKMRWASYVARTEDKRKCIQHSGQKTWWEETNWKN